MEIKRDNELNDWLKITAEPVGIVRNTLIVPPLAAGEEGLKLNDSYESPADKLAETALTDSEILIGDEFSELLDGTEGYSHLIVIYWGHEISQKARRLKKVRPAGLTDFLQRGIFSTLSPARPNPLLLSVVKLNGRSGNRLYVSGLDAINNSPVLDIKPYIPEIFPHEGTVIPDWMGEAMDRFR